MRWLAATVVCTFLALAGCHRHCRPGEVVRDPRPNLALGPDAECLVIASGLGRSDWPSAVHGYRSDAITYYTSLLYDQQYQYDDWGALVHEIQTVRMGVWQP
ncbi:MAG: hypothetical protein AB1716_13765 [Planctomycetota bacterium]